MPRHEVTKDFPYSDDGVTIRHLTAGSTEDIRPELAAGLVAGGYISDPEVASKVAGAAVKNADHAGAVDSDALVKRKIAHAEANISDGHIGKPEAEAIVDEHRLTSLSTAEDKQAAAAEKADHEAKGGRAKGGKR